MRLLGENVSLKYLSTCTKENRVFIHNDAA